MLKGVSVRQRSSLAKPVSAVRVPRRGMAADAKALKIRIGVVSTIQKITKAMKMVAAAKLTGLQRSLMVVRDFSTPLTDLWKIDLKTPVATRALCVISSDRGLCGALNSGLARNAKKMLNEANVQKKGLPYTIVPLGNKGRNSLDRAYNRWFSWHLSEYGKLKSFQFKAAVQIADRLIKMDVDEYHFMYNKFKNMMVTEQSEDKLYAPRIALLNQQAIQRYEVENSGIKSIITDLYEYRFAVRIWSMFNENLTSEMSARMNAMQNSSKAAGDMLGILNLLYNRTRQAKITTELIEIVSGAVAIESQGKD
jgi:F-type H+-transporting ATPase subunit gamma